MDPTTLRAALRRRPFCPFRLVTDNGSSHEVRALDQAVLTSTDIAIAQEGESGDMPDWILTVPLSKIVRIEWLAAGGNQPAPPPSSVNPVEPTVNPEILHEMLHAVPFQPFRVFVSDGSLYDVRHPELMYVTCRWISIALSWRRRVPRDTVFLNPLHITRIEPLPEDDSGSRQAV
jgi:hypothetical protein